MAETTLKTAVVAPMPRASEMTEVRVNPKILAELSKAEEHVLKQGLQGVPH